MSDEALKGVKAGALSLALLGALFLGWRFLSPGSAGRGSYRVHAFLPDVAGVAPRSRVTLHGIPVGVVERLSLERGKARVDLRIEAGVRLHEQASIGRRASSILGENLLVLTPGLEGTPTLEEGAEITQLLEEPSLQALEFQLADILKDVRDVTRSLAGSVGTEPGRQAMEGILRNLAVTTDQLRLSVQENRANLRETLAQAHALSADARPRVQTILEDVSTVTAELRRAAVPAPPDTTPRASTESSGGGEFHRALRHAERASAELESTLRNAEEVSGRLARGEGSLGRLTKDETLVREVEGVAKDVGQLVGGLTRLRTIVSLRSDYGLRLGGLKNSAELRLQPLPDRYYMFQLVSDPRGSFTRTERELTTTDPRETARVYETITEVTNAFRFSAQLARRIGPLTGRFGIMESTGGVGLDWSLFGDRVELTQDLFGFDEHPTARWRVGLAWELLDSLWLFGGADDLLSGERRDYLVGLRLRFDDPELKPILPFLPTSR